MQKLLIISSVWVEPNSSAAGSRMLQLIDFFLSQKYKITYASTALESDFAFDLTTLNIDCQSIKVNDASFDDFMTHLQADIVLFDRFMMEEQFGWRVAENSPNALRILDTEDLHCLRYARELALKNDIDFKKEDITKTEVAKREIASILRCDLSLMISTYEINLLKNIFKIDRHILLYIPFLLDKVNEETFLKLPNFEERAHFYFVGNFYHKPNVDCVNYLKKEIWSKIAKQLPKAELHIYGAYMPEKVKQLHNKKERFIIKGKAENLSEIVQNSRVCLAPLRFGAGIKGKFIEAMQNGTPNITTSIGVEAMSQNLKWSGSIANTSDEIVNEAVLLYNNKANWLKAQENGIQIINTNFNKPYFSKILKEKIAIILSDLETHRQQNFIGSLLQYHTLKSTKYLSKWIEEKNKD